MPSMLHAKIYNLTETAVTYNSGLAYAYHVERLPLLGLMDFLALWSPYRVTLNCSTAAVGVGATACALVQIDDHHQQQQAWHRVVWAFQGTTARTQHLLPLSVLSPHQTTRLTTTHRQTHAVLCADSPLTGRPAV